MSALKFLDAVPEGLWHTRAKHLHDLLDGPTLLRIEGERSPALFVSVLLHGNETSGWDGLRGLLQETPEPPRDMLVFIANIEAAAAGVRHLPDQPDYNRIWLNPEATMGSAAAVAQELLEYLRQQPPFAAIDLHNNTGHNPHYSVLTQVTTENCGLAYLLGDRAVLVEEPATVLTKAIDPVCPAITVELGPVSDPQGAERARLLLKNCLQLDVVPGVKPQDLVVYRSMARVHVRPKISFGFTGDSEDQDCELMITGGLEAVNFHALEEGTEFAATNGSVEAALQVLDAANNDVTDQFFRQVGDKIELARTVIPAMFTSDHEVVRQDCLCYFMDPLAD